MYRNVLVAASLWFALQATGTGQLINVGSHDLLPNVAGQEIAIFVSGGGQIHGVDFIVQIGNGGPYNGFPADGPHITDIDLISPPAIFASDNIGQFDSITTPQKWESFTFANGSGTVDASGLLATITLDTTAVMPSTTWALILTDPTTFEDENGETINPTIFDGLITVVPEPSAIVLGILAMAALGVFGACRRGAGRSWRSSLGA
jgi:PEP-CTERM motif